MSRSPLGILAAAFASICVGLPQVAEAASLIVHVENGLTGAPMSGAFVMVGAAEDDPFAGNTGNTDAGGTITFDDPDLSGPQTVTAGSAAFGYTTLYEAAVDEVTLRLYPRLVDEDMGGDHTRVEGEVDNVSNTSNDGFLDVSIVLNAVSPETVMFFDYLPFLFGIETVEFPVVGEVDLPENVFVTRQTEVLFLIFHKTPYRLGVPGNRPVSFVSVTARAEIAELTSDPDLSALEIREVGVERDVNVTAPGIVTLDIDSDIDTQPTGVTISFLDVPAGVGTRILSGSTAGSGNSEELFGYSTLYGLIDENASYDVAGFNPTGDMSDVSNVALAEYFDPSDAATYAVGIINRSGFSVPTNLNFDTWLAQPALTQDGLTLNWEDPTVDGISPTPTWTRSALGLRAVDPTDTSVTPTVDWRFWAAAAPGEIEIPSLPVSAPGPLGGFTDPDSTPENDQIAWSWTAVNSSADVDILVGGNFLADGTHWTQGWIPIDLNVSSTPESEQAVARIPMSAAPSPSQGDVSIRFDRQIEANGRLEILSADGRRIRNIDLSAGTTEWKWDGRDSQGAVVSGGVYWGQLTSGGKVLGQTRIVRVR